MLVKFAFLSHVGLVRSGNEDSGLAESDPAGERGHLLVVADGMGGAAAGEVASRMAVDTIRELYFASEEPPGPALASALSDANARIFAAGARGEEEAGMGTTCTAVVVVADRAYVGSVGDSRAYRIRNGEIERLTDDQSLWAEQVAQGVPPSSEHGRNQLTHAMGLESDFGVVDTIELDVRPDDRLLLCSDGLWGLATDPEMQGIAATGSLEEACQRLIDLANERGGGDNITVVLADLTDDESG